MYKTLAVVISIFVFLIGCSVFHKNKPFEFEMHSVMHSKFDFGFYEVPQSFEISDNCEIFISGTTSKMDEPTDYMLIKLNNEFSLNDSFYGNGSRMFDIDAGIDEGNQILLLDDDTLIIGGRSNHGVDIGTVLFDYSLGKFDTDGKNIKSFGERGKVITDFGYRDDAINKLILNEDGTFFAIGRASNGKDDDFAVAKYTSDGDLDYSFNKIGRVMIDFGLSDDVAYSAVKTQNGDLIIGGSSNAGATPKVAFTKIDNEGNLDKSFGDNGFKVWKFSPPGLIYDLSLIDDVVYASGFIDNLQNFNMLVTKFNIDGQIDDSFGKNGTKIFSDIEFDSISTGILAINKNQILLTGSIHNQNNEDASIVMIDSSGKLDKSFGVDGIYKLDYGKNEVFTDVLYFNEEIYAIGLHSDEDEGDVIIMKIHKKNSNKCK